MLIEWVVDRPELRLGFGDSSQYDGDADLVFTHPYCHLPTRLIGKPAIINTYGRKSDQLEKWCGAWLHKVSKWHNATNALYTANWDPPNIDLNHMLADAPGWFPLELTDKLLEAFLASRAAPKYSFGITVWDGFMGRGTVGKSCQRLGLDFVGIDWQRERVELARAYLGC